MERGEGLIHYADCAFSPVCGVDGEPTVWAVDVTCDECRYMMENDRQTRAIVVLMELALSRLTGERYKGEGAL